MWNSLSIAKKIYLSIGIIVLGYTASMFFVVLEGARAQEHLTSVSSALFPASLQSQTAVAAYDLQLKAYEDAVTVGDKKLLEVARQNGEAALAALDAVAKLPGLGRGELEKVGKLSEKLKGYLSHQKNGRKTARYLRRPLGPDRASGVPSAGRAGRTRPVHQPVRGQTAGHRRAPVG